MKLLLFAALMLLAACVPAEESSMHSITMENLGPEVYDFRIQYGQAVLPFGNRGDPEFGGGSVYTDDMPVPETAIVEWRTVPAPQGRALRFEVPLRDAIQQDERTSRFLTIEFRLIVDSLEVRVGKNAAEAMDGRLIYSSSAEVDPSASK